MNPSFILLVLVCPHLVIGLPLDRLYPYGVDDGDSYLPKSDDIGSEPIKLKLPIKFFKETYSTIYVNNNGIVSLLGPLEKYEIVQFPLEYLVIAPLYANVDTRLGGTVWYRESFDEELLERSASRLNRLYPTTQPFRPKSLFLATWDAVAHINTTGETNTFQMALSNDGEESFLELMYPDGGINWIRTRGQGQNQADGKAQAGIVSHDARLITLPNSGTDQIRNLDKLSNSGEPGLFVFRVGKIDDAETIEPPPAYVDVYEQEPTNCAQGFTRCHSKAECVDTQQGFCCKCQEGYYGNGINCLVENVAVRVSGKVSMAGENEMYLQAYLVPGEGASYTAVIKVPPRLGPSLQLLEPLAATLGWLIAKPISDGVNGFHLTGGVFNSSVEVRWPGGEKMVIKTRYFGVDLVDQLRMEADISGTLPAVPPHRTLNVPDYHQELTRTDKGVLRSLTQVKILVEGTEGDSDKGVFVFSKTETIEFEEYCSPVSSLRLKSSRHQLAYRPEEEVTRFTSVNKISANIEGEDPCIEGQIKCVANSSCVVDGDSFRCICNPGFEQMADLVDGCHDINECEEGSANCHPHAICVNEVGTFHCQCRPGYRGNGLECTSEEECDGRDCDQPSNGFCSDVNYVESCSCDPGYAGYADGGRFECWDVNECLEPNVCGGDDKSECLNSEGSYSCLCRSGYQLINNFCTLSDEEDQCEEDPESCQPEHGYCHNFKDFNTCKCVAGWRGSVSGGKFICVDNDECTESPCDHNAQCFNNWGSFDCKCKQGYSGDGFTCDLLQDLEDCFELDCGSRSHCEEEFGKPHCVCDSEYSGQHPNCIDVDLIDCYEDDECGLNAFCEKNSEYYRCVCNEGYKGDGYVCKFVGTSNQLVSGDTTVRTCLNGACWCPLGYEDNGFHCAKRQKGLCNEQCSSNAKCVYVPQSQEYQCSCNPGFEGNGVECTLMEISCSIAEICDINAMCKFDEYSNMDVCICNEGYVGDGTTCYLSDECTSSVDCKMNAGCVYNEDRQANECVCAEGYDKDHEGNCLPLHVGGDDSEESCSEICSEHASCESGRCVCQVGYRGDGLTCSADCLALENCSPFADCVYNTFNFTYSCICKKGYVGDGYECNLIQNCLNTPTLCSKYATCLRTAQHTYTCTCNQGYYGNGSMCREATRLDSGGFLLVNQGRSTQKMALFPSPENRGKPIHLHFDQVPIGIATDCVEGRVYWSDIAQKTIQSSKYDGSDTQQIINSGIESSEGVAVDWLNRAIYWTDSALDSISKADLDTRESVTIVRSGLVNPRGIAVHPARRKVYWSDWDRDDPKLEMSNLDGSDRSILLKGSHVKLPNSLAIDWSRDELCWSDAGTHNIECLGLTTGRHRTAVKGCKYPFGLAITSEMYYWTDWVTHKIESATKDGKIGKPFQMLFGDDKLYGLAAVPETCPN